MRITNYSEWIAERLGVVAWAGGIVLVLLAALLRALAEWLREPYWWETLAR
jgi:hypothetical protein